MRSSIHTLSFRLSNVSTHQYYSPHTPHTPSVSGSSASVVIVVLVTVKSTRQLTCLGYLLCKFDVVPLRSTVNPAVFPAGVCLLKICSAACACLPSTLYLLNLDTAVGPAGTNTNIGRKFADVGIVTGAGGDVVVCVTTTVELITSVSVVADGVTVTVARDVYVMLMRFVVIS
jgi:hypothetical protein